MIEIKYQRSKCTACNFCVEMDPENWKMDWLDDKSILRGSTKSNGLYTLTLDSNQHELQQKIAEGCSEGIIKVRKI